MVSKTPVLPCLELNIDPKAMGQGSDEWPDLCHRVCKSLEEHGVFLVKYDEITGQMREEISSAMFDLFDLSPAAKHKIMQAFPTKTFLQPEGYPLLESIGVINLDKPGELESFAKLAWPNGYNRFCASVASMGAKMKELNRVIVEMILDGYKMDRCCEELLSFMEIDFRMNKYFAPMKDEPQPGVWTHIDNNFLTILCQNDVDGLQVKPRDGEWFSVNPGQGWFVVFAGFALQAWSNGRIHAPPHNAMISGVKDRFTYGIFVRPKSDQIVDAPRELIDLEHPRKFKPFEFGGFSKYIRATVYDDYSLDTYAGV